MEEQVLKPAEQTTQEMKKRDNRVKAVQFETKEQLLQAYMPYIKQGGLFIHTDQGFQLGDELFLLIQLPNDTQKYTIAGKIIWITPPRAQGNRKRGVGVQLRGKEGEQVLSKIETHLAGMLAKKDDSETM